MSQKRKPVSVILLLITFLVCLTPAALFTRGSADLEAVASGTDIFSEGSALGQTLAGEEVLVQKDESDGGALEAQAPQEPVGEEKSSEGLTASDILIPVPTVAAYEVSPEAATGVWTAQGSDWMFLVNGQPYTGWLMDTDGKRYFFNKNGIMKTGWIKKKGSNYYLNADGVMQTGTITVDGSIYHLGEDGKLLDPGELTVSSEEEA